MSWRRGREKEDYYSLTLGTRAAGAPSGRIEIEEKERKEVDKAKVAVMDQCEQNRLPSHVARFPCLSISAQYVQRRHCKG